MAFTRDELAAYEKSTPAAETSQPAALEQETATPAVAESAPAESEASSANDDATPPGDTGTDGSSDEHADTSTARADSESETPATDDEGTETPRGSRARERIEELVAERNALRKYGEHLLARVEELAGAKGVKPGTSTDTAESVTRPDGDDPAPTLEEHEFDPSKFQDAQNKWIQRQVDKRVAAAVQSLETKQTRLQIAKAFEERTKVLKETAKDFDIVVSNPALPKLAPSTVGLIVRSELGPNITYHLGKNPDLATRISRMTPEQQHAAIGRLEVELAKPAAQAPKPAPRRTVSNAPPPPKPVPSGSSGIKDINQMSMDEFVAHERAQKIARRDASLKVRTAMR